jgi:predicted NBD/HSP70 family sugar kinase
MSNRKKTGSMNYIGVDIGKRNCVVCVMDSNGSIIKETNYNNTLEQAESFASSIKRKRGGGSRSIAVCLHSILMFLVL